MLVSILSLRCAHAITSCTTASVTAAMLRGATGGSVSVLINRCHCVPSCRSMLMTACDISAITKPWPVQKRVTEIYLYYFFFCCLLCWNVEGPHLHVLLKCWFLHRHSVSYFLLGGQQRRLKYDTQHLRCVVVIL